MFTFFAKFIFKVFIFSPQVFLKASGHFFQYKVSLHLSQNSCDHPVSGQATA
jgi:hypothetical protein